MFKFETQGANANLVYVMSETESLDSLCLGMISNNKIKGVIPVVFSQMDENVYLKYNVSGKIPLSEYFKGNVSKKKMLNVLSGISAAIMVSEEYMIDQSYFVLDAGYIFVDSISEELNMVCLPVNGSGINRFSLAEFFKQIVVSTQLDLSENCDYFAKLISYFNVDKTFSVAEFRQFVEALKSTISYAAPVVATPVAPVAPPVAPVAPTVAPVASAPIVANTSHPPVSGMNVAPTPPLVQNPQNAKQPPQVPVPAKKEKGNKKEKKAKKEEGSITLLKLLTSYSKENLELYKSQKAANQSKPVAPASNKKAKPAVDVGFAVPNQPAPMKAKGMDVPSKVPHNQPVAAAIPLPQVPKAPPAKPAPVTTPVLGETTVLNAVDSGGETTVLSAVEIKPVPYLIRIRTNERINIDKPCFRIGKERSYVDYFISDNTAISRSHADIVTNSRGYYIIDKNSTNHTYVNGVAIPSESEVKLETGYKVRLANEEFQFYIG